MNDHARETAPDLAWAALKSNVLDVLDDREQALLWAINWCEKRPGQAGRILDWLEQIPYTPDQAMQGQVWRLAVENHPDQIQRCLDLLLTRDNTPGSLDRQLETLAQYLAYPSTWTAAYAKGMSALLNAASRTVRGKKSLLWYLWPVAMDGALAIEKDGGLLRWLIETHDMATASVCGKRGRGMNGFHLLVLGSHHLAEYRGPDSLDAGRVAWICDQLLSGGGEPKGPMVYLDNECQEGFSSPLALACRFYEEGDLDGMIVDALITAGADWMALADGETGHVSMDRILAHPRVKAKALQAHIHSETRAGSGTAPHI